MLRKFDELVGKEECIHGWLMSHIHDDAKKWIDNYDAAFPADPDISYVTFAELEAADSEVVSARLPQLALHEQSGSSGLLEAPIARVIIGSMLTDGFKTDAITGHGVEYLADKGAVRSVLARVNTLLSMAPRPANGNLQKLFPFFHVKGWKQSVVATLAFTLLFLLEAIDQLSRRVGASFATAHCLIQKSMSMKYSLGQARKSRQTLP